MTASAAVDTVGGNIRAFSLMKITDTGAPSVSARVNNINKACFLKLLSSENVQGLLNMFKSDFCFLSVKMVIVELKMMTSLPYND